LPGILNQHEYFRIQTTRTIRLRPSYIPRWTDVMGSDGGAYEHAAGFPATLQST
jgi:hypothetical protein